MFEKSDRSILSFYVVVELNHFVIGAEPSYKFTNSESLLKDCDCVMKCLHFTIAVFPSRKLKENSKVTMVTYRNRGFKSPYYGAASWTSTPGLMV
jgi:hypothetical protein